MVKNSSPNSEDPKDLDWIPGSGRFPGEGKDTPLQYSCLGNPMDRGTYDWGHKELDTTEQLRFFCFFFFFFFFGMYVTDSLCSTVEMNIL